MDASASAAAPAAAPASAPASLSGPAVLCLVLLPYALGHYLSCLLRTVNAVLAPQLVGAAALTPGDLGLLTSAYFLVFALAQLPVGVALDRFGPRAVQVPLLLLLLAGAGTCAFAFGTGFMSLLVARTVMGLGLAGCFMAAVKAIATWFPPARMPSVQGCLIAAGGLGAASSTLPVGLFLQHADWRTLFVVLALCCVALAMLILLVAPAQAATPKQPFNVAVFAEVFRHPAFRETASLVLVPHAVFFGIQGLWIGRWLTDVGHYSEQDVAWLLSAGMGAVIAGALAVGMVTEWAGRRGAEPVTVAGVGVALFVAVQCGFVLGWQPAHLHYSGMLSVLFALAGTITGIEYAIVARAMPPALTGRAATCLNLLIFLGAFVVQAGFGMIVGLWRPDAAQHYPAAAYRVAFGVLVLLQLPGIVRFFRRRRRPLPANPVESPL